MSCHEKIEVKVDKDGKKQYLFKPPFNIKKGKDLIELLKKYQTEGKGGLYLDDIQESLPNADKIIEVNKFRLVFLFWTKIILNKLKNINKSTDPNVQVEIRTIKRKGKKKLLFYNERNVLVHWRKVPTEGLDEAKIEEYLTNNLLTPMKGKVDENMNNGIDNTCKSKPKNKKFKKHNNHIDSLVDYNEELSIVTKKPF